jgi:uncharacterized protein YecE (DUF72 family)
MIFGIISVVLWILSLVIWVIYNLNNKNKKLEDTAINQANFINNIQYLIAQSDKSIRELDTKIWVEGDKELMVVFQNLKAIQEALNQFKGN